MKVEEKRYAGVEFASWLERDGREVSDILKEVKTNHILEITNYWRFEELSCKAQCASTSRYARFDPSGTSEWTEELIILPPGPGGGKAKREARHEATHASPVPTPGHIRAKLSYSLIDRWGGRTSHLQFEMPPLPADLD